MSDRNTYIVGKFYDVPTVYRLIYGVRMDWPVIGPMHEDAEIINFPWEHYHIDWRFVPVRICRSVAVKWHSYGLAGVYAIVLHARPEVHPKGLPAPVMKRMKCKMEFPEFPEHVARWLHELRKKYAGCKLKPGMVCPHRGVPLASLPSVDGIVTCPAHGLKWNVETGELVQ